MITVFFYSVLFSSSSSSSFFFFFAFRQTFFWGGEKWLIFEKIMTLHTANKTEVNTSHMIITWNHLGQSERGWRSAVTHLSNTTVGGAFCIAAQRIYFRATVFKIASRSGGLRCVWRFNGRWEFTLEAKASLQQLPTSRAERHRGRYPSRFGIRGIHWNPTLNTTKVSS